jgi:hypothetical protein
MLRIAVRLGDPRSRVRNEAAKRLECGENRRSLFGAERRASAWTKERAMLRIAVRLGDPLQSRSPPRGARAGVSVRRRARNAS